MYTQDEIKSLFDHIINSSNANETEILFDEYERSSTRFSNNVITQNLSQKNKSINIRVIKDKRIGLAETNNLSKESLLKTLNKALLSSQYQKQQDDILPLVNPQKYDETQNYLKDTAFINPVKKAEMIKMACDKAKENMLDAAGFFSNGYKIISIGNSKGLFAYNIFSTADYNLSMEDHNSSGWCEESSFDLSNIHLDTIIDRAIDITLKSRNPIDLDPGRYTVILSPDAIGELLYFLAFDGFNTLGIKEKSNYFHNKLGQKVFSDKLSIWDDYSHPLSNGIPFDFVGLPRKKVTLIEKGIFKEVVLDRKLAMEMGMDPNGHSLPEPNTSGPLPLNIVMGTGDMSIEEMIQSTDKGLYVNRLHYTNILDPMAMNLTGMTRDGLFLIENGKITKPVKNFRFTESLIHAFNQIEAIENKSTYIRSFFGGGFVVSGMKISDFNFSSKTEF